MSLKKIFNLHEEITYRRLQEVCEECGASVFAKVRVADVLPIENSGISSKDYRFALQSHFDFLVTDKDHLPLFAVEFDGPIHQNSSQMKRDEKKDRLCNKFSLPLLRINARYLPKKYKDMDLLTWIIEVWFTANAFYEAQNRGEIPLDEIFDPWSVWHITGKKNIQPFHLSRDLELNVQKLAKKEKIYSPGLSHIIAKDKKGNYRALGYVLLTKERGVYAETAMKAQSFPIDEIDLLGEIVNFETYQKLEEVLNGEAQASGVSEINEKIVYYHYNLELCMSVGSGRG